MEEEKTENQPKNSILKTFLICLVLIPSITAIWVINTSPVFNNEVKENKEFVDPKTVTEQQKLEGFTTERIYNHFQEFIDLYFADKKQAFDGWKIQYKKNEEWNKITWTTVDGKVSNGHYAGMCDYEAKIIYLNDDYFPRFDSHDDVLLHEMIHVVCPDASHQGDFMKECTRIGKISPFTRAKIYGYDGWGSVE